jgi:hypothetical protein
VKLSERREQLEAQRGAIEAQRGRGEGGSAAVELAMIDAEREFLVELLCVYSAELREREVPQRRPRLTAIDGGGERR